MTRQLTITAAEWASVQDGTLWLVREGDDCACSSDGGTWAGGGGFALSCPICHDADSVPPAEFMQTSAPCVPSAPWHERAHAGCNYLPGHFSGGALYCNKCGWAAPCPDCRIELVGPCICPTDVHYLCAKSECPTVTLGHAYAVGQPLPIPPMPDHMADESSYTCDWGHCSEHTVTWRWAFDLHEWLSVCEDHAAQVGPPATLVGKWAQQLAVQP